MTHRLLDVFRTVFSNGGECSVFEGKAIGSLGSLGSLLGVDFVKRSACDSCIERSSYGLILNVELYFLFIFVYNLFKKLERLMEYALLVLKIELYKVMRTFGSVLAGALEILS